VLQKHESRTSPHYAFRYPIFLKQREINASHVFFMSGDRRSGNNNAGGWHMLISRQMETKFNHMAEETKKDSPQNEGAQKPEMRNAGDERRPRARGGNAPVAKDPSIRRDELADPSEIPGNKEVPSALPGAEMEGDLGTVAGSAAAGTKGASKSSEGRKGKSGNYGANQTGPGLATGPMSTTPDTDAKT
jgi:hypothetical protein